MQRLSEKNKEIEEMTDLEKELLAIIEDFIDCVNQPPEKNCQCAIAPPCYDCVEHSMLRDTLKNAKAIIAKAQGETE